MSHPLLVPAIANVVVFSAFFVRALTGFGSALVSIPLLALLFDLGFVVPLEALFEVAISLLLLRRAYPAIRKQVLAPLVAGAVCGSVLGASLLRALANALLKRGLGLVIILFGVHVGFDAGLPTERALSPAWGLVAGMLGGILGGLFGTSGPAFVLYLAHRLRDKEALWASLIGLFAVDYAWRVCVFAMNGLLTREVLRYAVILTPALVAGTMAGHRVHVRMDERRFRKIVAAVLVLSGALLLVR